jgi:hypothetical protein
MTPSGVFSQILLLVPPRFVAPSALTLPVGTEEKMPVYDNLAPSVDKITGALPNALAHPSPPN